MTATLITSSITGDNCSWIATYAYTVKDGCDNFAANAVVEYTGGDTEAPTASDPAPLAFQCIADIPAPDVNVVTDGG
ncbi:MAG: hypothetical protein IPJ40_08010 [Saprospirales bacterium]|nr:hypothetical protein [Saprospirales bacterium]